LARARPASIRGRSRLFLATGVKATFDALKKLKSREDVAALRGKSVQEL